MSTKKPSRKIGAVYSEQEAMEILEECIAIRLSLEVLEEQAIASLMAPEIKLVVDND
jgi:hypothetical protein